MSFKIEPVQGPAPVEGFLQNRQKSSKDRAVEAFMNPTGAKPVEAPQAPTLAPNMAPPMPQGPVSPEDLATIKALQNKPNEQNTITEAPAAATPPASASEATNKQEVEQSLSPRYAQLARQEKALRARHAAIQAEKAEMQKAREALEAERASMQGKFVPIERLKRETLAVLQEQGVDYNDLTQQVLSSPDPEIAKRDAHIAKLESRLEEIMQKVEGTQKSIEEGQQQSYNQAIAQIRQEASRLVKVDPAFETIKATNAVGEVVDLIQKTFEEGLDEEYPKGTLLSVEEACQLVEEELTEQYTKVARLEKIRKRLEASNKPSTPSQPQSTTQQSQPKPTLTNSMTGAPKKEYTAKQRAVFAAQYGSNWQEKVGT